VQFFLLQIPKIGSEMHKLILQQCSEYYYNINYGAIISKLTDDFHYSLIYDLYLFYAFHRTHHDTFY